MYHSNVKCPSCCEGEHCMNNLNERNLELPNRRDSSVIQFIHSMNLNLKKKRIHNNQQFQQLPSIQENSLISFAVG